MPGNASINEQSAFFTDINTIYATISATISTTSLVNSSFSLLFTRTVIAIPSNSLSIEASFTLMSTYSTSNLITSSTSSLTSSFRPTQSISIVTLSRTFLSSSQSYTQSSSSSSSPLHVISTSGLSSVTSPTLVATTYTVTTIPSTRVITTSVTVVVTEPSLTYVATTSFLTTSISTVSMPTQSTFSTDFTSVYETSIDRGATSVLSTFTFNGSLSTDSASHSSAGLAAQPGAIVGIAVAVAVVVIGAALIVFLILRRRKNKHEDSNSSHMGLTRNNSDGQRTAPLESELDVDEFTVVNVSSPPSSIPHVQSEPGHHRSNSDGPLARSRSSNSSNHVPKSPGFGHAADALAMAGPNSPHLTFNHESDVWVKANKRIGNNPVASAQDATSPNSGLTWVESDDNGPAGTLGRSGSSSHGHSSGTSSSHRMTSRGPSGEIKGILKNNRTNVPPSSYRSTGPRVADGNTETLPADAAAMDMTSPVDRDSEKQETGVMGRRNSEPMSLRKRFGRLRSRRRSSSGAVHTSTQEVPSPSPTSPPSPYPVLVSSSAPHVTISVAPADESRVTSIPVRTPSSLLDPHRSGRWPPSPVLDGSLPFWTAEQEAALRMANNGTLWPQANLPPLPQPSPALSTASLLNQQNGLLNPALSFGRLPAQSSFVTLGDHVDYSRPIGEVAMSSMLSVSSFPQRKSIASLRDDASAELDSRSPDALDDKTAAPSCSTKLESSVVPEVDVAI
ncbi:hypothetical protein FISHEDRAFT_70572 [Fistulina hepatica ATCC 64428]|uniref:REJ domain-containing protein n=1 Tax=Fistulina hepatica ATCC 64428 TaxID=1128425 RepID=A0A0D7AI99_9AGAR|nr:hypothetical protein FISHEDRAFT_70572 [Fistulina hepatica ATCC 64428]